MNGNGFKVWNKEKFKIRGTKKNKEPHTQEIL